MSGEWTHIDSVSSRPLSPSDFLFEDTHDASSTEPAHEDSRRIGERGAAVAWPPLDSRSEVTSLLFLESETRPGDGSSMLP